MISIVFKRTKNPSTNLWEEAMWTITKTGEFSTFEVEFADGIKINPEVVELETTEESIIKVHPHPKRPVYGPPRAPDRTISF